MNLENIEFCFLHSLHHNTPRQRAHPSASTYTKMLVLSGSAFSNLRKSELLIFRVSNTQPRLCACPSASINTKRRIIPDPHLPASSDHRRNIIRTFRDSTWTNCVSELVSKTKKTREKDFFELSKFQSLKNVVFFRNP